MAELADAPDLGSGGTPVQVQVLSPAPKDPFTDFGERIFLFVQLSNSFTFLAAAIFRLCAHFGNEYPADKSDYISGWLAPS